MTDELLEVRIVYDGLQPILTFWTIFLTMVRALKNSVPRRLTILGYIDTDEIFPTHMA
jgi:hypothetical protein